MVADRIFKYMVDNDEINIRVNKAIEKAEKAIINNYFKSVDKVLKDRDNVR